MELIRIDRLSKSFGRTAVLKDISLVYEPGKIYGIVGENGAGKTTLFNCIVGLHEYDGIVSKAPEIRIGYQPADSFFYSLVTGMEYLAFCVKAKERTLDRKEIERINSVFQLPLHRYASDYSTGMKKKLAFLALILQNNDLYILDEPFNGVDLKGCIQLKRTIRLLRDEGKTFVISSHQIATLHEISDSIDYLNNRTVLKRYVHETVENIEKDILGE